MCLVWSQAVFVRSPSYLTTVRSPSYLCLTCLRLGFQPTRHPQHVLWSPRSRNHREYSSHIAKSSINYGSGTPAATHHGSWPIHGAGTGESPVPPWSGQRQARRSPSAASTPHDPLLSSASPASSLWPSRAWSHCGAVAAPSRCADRNPHATAPPPRAHWSSPYPTPPGSTAALRPHPLPVQRFPLNLSCERKTICNMLFGNWLWQQTRSSYCTLSMLLVL